jgi:hypothetical protein
MVEQAASVDEATYILNHAEAMRAYARIAGNKEMQVNAVRIIERAERRLGELLAAQREAGLLNPDTRTLGGGTGAGGFIQDPPADLPTLKQLGISKALANRARKTWELPLHTFEAASAERGRQIMRGGRVKSLLSIANQMQEEEQRNATQAAAVAAMPALITDRYRLICDDMSTTKAVGREAADQMVTDLPYAGKYLVCYEDLGRRAFELLKPGASLAVMCGHAFLPQVFAALEKSGLMYRWTFCCEMNGARTYVRERHILTSWKPVLLYRKDKIEKGHQYNCDDLPWIGDVIKSDERDKRYHRWGQSVAQFEKIVELVSLPGQIILDPFCGGGTTGVAALRLGRQFIGIDIDERAIATTAERLSKVECEPAVEEQQDNDQTKQRDG